MWLLWSPQGLKMTQDFFARRRHQLISAFASLRCFCRGPWPVGDVAPWQVQTLIGKIWRGNNMFLRCRMLQISLRRLALGSFFGPLVGLPPLRLPGDRDLPTSPCFCPCPPSSYLDRASCASEDIRSTCLQGIQQQQWSSKRRISCSSGCSPVRRFPGPYSISTYGNTIRKKKSFWDNH